VCRIYEFNRAGGTAFITMELIEGITLHDWLRQRGRLTAQEGVRIARQICAALREAHHQGIIHRDLKPSNIMIDRGGNAKIMDFGIARSLDASVTVTGMVLGTPAYMAPEQAEGRSVDARTDIYLLGLILYEIFTGTVAFSGDTPFLIALKQMREDPPPPRQIDPNLPTYLDELIMRCLQKDASLRFPSVDELEAALGVEPPSADSGGRKVQVEG
jgi:serine/threonine protein kinase